MTLEGVPIPFEKFFDIPEGYPLIQTMAYRRRLVSFVGVSRIGNIVVEVDGLKGRVTTGRFGILMPKDVAWKWGLS